MAEIPHNSLNTELQSTSSVKPSQQPVLSTSAKLTDIPSQILAKTDDTITLSLPNRKPLTLDINGTTQFNIGDKINITLIKDNQNIAITMTKQPVMPQVELSLPASHSLLKKLNQHTSLPPQIDVIKAHLTNNENITLGQVRRLPQEQISLQINQSTAIKASLPGISALPLNQTMQASLVLSKDNELLVQFRQRPPAPQSTSLVIPLQQLSTNNILQSLPASQVGNIHQVLSNNQLIQTFVEPALDMNKPLNQLWLRQQPMTQTLDNLTINIKEVFSLSHDQLKAQANLLIKNELPINTQKLGQQYSDKAANAALIESDSTQRKNTQSSTPNVTPMPLKELGKTHDIATKEAPLFPHKNQTPENKTTTDEKLLRLPPEMKTDNKLTSTNDIKTTSPIVINNTNLTKSIDSKAAEARVTPNNDTKNASPASTHNALDGKNIDVTKVRDNTLTAALAQATKAPINIGDSVTSSNKTKAIASTTSMSNIDDLSKQDTIVTDKNPSMPLKKLNALIGLLNNTNASTPHSASQISAQLEAKAASSLVKTDVAINHQQTPVTDEQLAAVDEIKTLSQRLVKQLPTMGQLTNPQQLAHIVEQYSRFEPLNSASVSLTTLGPLASALQLMLGGRHIASGQQLSPQLLKHLNQLLKQSKGNNSHLTSALQLLGNLQSLKPLDDALTNLSANIQFYQYQNLEQQQNNPSLFYFNVPTKEQQVSQIEGEVEEQQEEYQGGQKSWRLTLLVPCGNNEKIKVNALLTGQGVELDLTCNSDSLLERAIFYQDFLTSRLEALGFDKPTVKCQQGDIPTSLIKRPNQLVELII